MKQSTECTLTFVHSQADLDLGIQFARGGRTFLRIHLRPCMGSLVTPEGYLKKKPTN